MTGPSVSGSDHGDVVLGRAALVMLAVAAVTRVLAIVVEPAYLHPDALYQGLEPAYWLLHGEGLLPWEFRDGLRSWLWPGLLAGPMGVGELAGIGSGMAIFFVRAFVASVDLVGVWLAIRLARAHSGRVAGLAVATTMALHPAFVVMATNPLIDVPAAVALLWLCERALAADEVTHRRAAALGIASALTLLLRIQAAPAVLAALAIVALRTRAGRTRWVGGAPTTAIVVGVALILAAGMLDWATWGSPFASTWRYVWFNLREGARFGVMPAERYARDFASVFPVAWPVLVAFAAIGGRRAPALLVVFLAFVVPHQLLSLRVWRFLYPAMGLGTVLCGIGVGAALEWLGLRRAAFARAAGMSLAGILAVDLAIAGARDVPWTTTWLYAQGGFVAIERSRGLARAYVRLSETSPPPRAIVQAVLPSGGAPGQALLGSAAPVASPMDGGDAWMMVAREADVWIQPAAAPTPPAFVRSWCDEGTGVCIDRRVPG